jgi:hypothetical protein
MDCAACISCDDGLLVRELKMFGQGCAPHRPITRRQVAGPSYLASRGSGLGGTMLHDRMYYRARVALLTFRASWAVSKRTIVGSQEQAQLDAALRSTGKFPCIAGRGKRSSLWEARLSICFRANSLDGGSEFSRVTGLTRRAVRGDETHRGEKLCHLCGRCVGCKLALT